MKQKKKGKKRNRGPLYPAQESSQKGSYGSKGQQEVGPGGGGRRTVYTRGKTGTALGAMKLSLQKNRFGEKLTGKPKKKLRGLGAHGLEKNKARYKKTPEKGTLK